MFYQTYNKRFIKLTVIKKIKYDDSSYDFDFVKKKTFSISCDEYCHVVYIVYVFNEMNIKWSKLYPNIILHADVNVITTWIMRSMHI